MTVKSIFNPSLARKLLKMGNTIIDIKPKKENKNETIFIFKCDEKLINDIKNII